MDEKNSQSNQGPGEGKSPSDVDPKSIDLEGNGDNLSENSKSISIGMPASPDEMKKLKKQAKDLLPEANKSISIGIPMSQEGFKLLKDASRELRQFDQHEDSESQKDESSDKEE